MCSLYLTWFRSGWLSRSAAVNQSQLKPTTTFMTPMPIQFTRSETPQMIRNTHSGSFSLKEIPLLEKLPPILRELQSSRFLTSSMDLIERTHSLVSNRQKCLWNYQSVLRNTSMHLGQLFLQHSLNQARINPYASMKVNLWPLEAIRQLSIKRAWSWNFFPVKVTIAFLNSKPMLCWLHYVTESWFPNKNSRLDFMKPMRSSLNQSTLSP